MQEVQGEAVRSIQDLLITDQCCGWGALACVCLLTNARAHTSAVLLFILCGSECQRGEMRGEVK